VGLWDENFYPAYMEDIDWFRRSKLAGETIVQALNVQMIHGLGKTIDFHSAIKRENDRTYANNCEYYRLKWGGGHRQELFDHPFNDPNWPIDLWRFEPYLRKQNQWKLPPPGAA